MRMEDFKRDKKLLIFILIGMATMSLWMMLQEPTWRHFAKELLMKLLEGAVAIKG